MKHAASFTRKDLEIDSMNSIYEMDYQVGSRDFAAAGDASRSIKRTLQQIGVDTSVVRRIAIASYEAEMNIAIHSKGGKMCLSVNSDKVVVSTEDFGPGIENVELAMTEGWSTATAEIREMGFGAGMGLPNMKKCADEFFIESKISEGTKIKMIFKL
ncbi:Anti-sigma regulatory factor (Ser/Thr protein kinase) [Alkalibacter saccharofermentans DSM 14828]|uniref:Anti-sigma regulatory factor (Ser/Thr protein kinase) n=2 Tax=Alkalibacter TaxID=274470 RepID=A0A1M4VGW4_9FIRM|nr:Anti-sigma regulatory factor (Ser/Thr protein kinase) [Alkalibacter saccharofermentans DSM 14828]